MSERKTHPRYQSVEEIILIHKEALKCYDVDRRSQIKALDEMRRGDIQLMNITTPAAAVALREVQEFYLGNLALSSARHMEEVEKIGREYIKYIQGPLRHAERVAARIQRERKARLHNGN